MIDTMLIKIIILSLNLIFYSSGAKKANIDMIDSGKYAGTFSYEIENNKMIVSLSQKNTTKKMMTITTVDNGLYSVKMENESPFEIDLAGYYQEIDWENIQNINKKFNITDDDTVELNTSRTNLYVQCDTQTFIISKKILLKNSKVSNRAKPDKQFRIARKSGSIKKMSAAVKFLTGSKKIQKGMSLDEVVELLGPADHFTGIYISGGISYGYGNIKPSTSNYYKFYWLHFKPDDKKSEKDEDKYLLEAWD